MAVIAGLLSGVVYAKPLLRPETRIKALEAENAKLKNMLAEHMLDLATLKEMLGRNVCSAPRLQVAW